MRAMRGATNGPFDVPALRLPESALYQELNCQAARRCKRKSLGSRKRAARRLRRNVDAPDRARIDFLDVARVQKIPEIAPPPSFHTASV
jgi:hypothetical protein